MKLTKRESPQKSMFYSCFLNVQIIEDSSFLVQQVVPFMIQEKIKLQYRIKPIGFFTVFDVHYALGLLVF